MNLGVPRLEVWRNIYIYLPSFRVDFDDDVYSCTYVRMYANEKSIEFEYYYKLMPSLWAESVREIRIGQI